MCIAVFVWLNHPLYPFLLLHNRDEYHNRPTKAISWWEDCEILGGRDGLAGGTWLACTREGRLAFVTNVRELNPSPEAKSRGDLPVRFLESRKSPMEFAEEVEKEAHQYNGFNLILTDLCSKTMVYVCNRPKGEPISIQVVSPGIHVLSNAKLDSPWFKARKYSILLNFNEKLKSTKGYTDYKPTVVFFIKPVGKINISSSNGAERLGQNFKALLDKCGEGEVPMKEMIEELMKDTVKADKSMLPQIYPPEWEFNSSSIFVEIDTPSGWYGTRSTAALSVRTSGEVSFYERYLEKEMWKEHTVNYQIDKVK
ncbi:hypothetical protein HHK36_008805 [Tetracentron sinense]|uniref:Transport and Golgi organization 2 homolog n=1 Tax=Tetracentron sinense TaxID=13715 RepID=A0A835DJN1_TETSI|nr:hypothetical protein HHK36_008805 [Tetracentron sinense]